MLENITHGRERAHQKFEVLANIHIAQYDVIKDNKEEIPHHK